MSKGDVAVVITIVIFFILDVVGLICINKYSNNKNTKIDTISIVDTSYNKTVLDSIKIDIKYKDSVIKRIKYEMQYEIKKVDTISDDDAVKLFIQLCTD